MNKTPPTFYPATSEAARRQAQVCAICWQVVHGRVFNPATGLCRKCEDAMNGKEDTEVVFRQLKRKRPNWFMRILHWIGRKLLFRKGYGS